jgi:hypothetical protein
MLFTVASGRMTLMRFAMAIPNFAYIHMVSTRRVDVNRVGWASRSAADGMGIAQAPQAGGAAGNVCPCFQ